MTALALEVFMVAAYLRADEVPFSGPHRMVLALDDEVAAASWLGGGDPLASAAVDREFCDAMAAGFDAAARYLHGLCSDTGIFVL